MCVCVCVCVYVCIKHERSSLPRPGSWTNGPFPPWSRGLLQSPSCPDGPDQPPHRSPQPLPTRLSLYCAQPGSSRKWGGCWVRGRPPAAPPPSPHCHSWLWPLAPAADAKNSLVHRETAAPLSGLPVDCSPPASSVDGILWARILQWWPFPSPGHLPDPGMEPGSPALQADSLVFEPLGKLGVLDPFLTWIFST